MKTNYLERYEFDDDMKRLQFDILEKWLSKTYWSPGIKSAEIEKGARHSALNLGCYLQDRQIGYLRIVSDKTRFGYVMDVYVDESHRKQGIAQAMVRFAIDHPDFKDVYLWLLGTRDGHSVYQKVGFGPLPAPERWMVLRKEKIR